MTTRFLDKYNHFNSKELYGKTIFVVNDVQHMGFLTIDYEILDKQDIDLLKKYFDAQVIFLDDASFNKRYNEDLLDLVWKKVFKDLQDEHMLTPFEEETA